MNVKDSLLIATVKDTVKVSYFVIRYYITAVSFYEEHTLNRKYIDTIFNSPNVQETVLLINSMQKRVQELNGYMLSGLKAKREQAEKELADINYVFEKYADKIDYLVENNVLQRSGSSDALFRVE